MIFLKKKRNGNKTKMAFILQGYAKRFFKIKTVESERLQKCIKLPFKKKVLTYYLIENLTKKG